MRPFSVEWSVSSETGSFTPVRQQVSLANTDIKRYLRHCETVEAPKQGLGHFNGRTAAEFKLSL